MSTTKQLLTNQYGIEQAAVFVQDVQEGAAHYVFAAKHTPYTGSDLTPADPIDSVRNDINVYNDMIFGNRIQSTDISRMVKRYDWTANTAYDMYDDQDTSLQSKQFFVTVQDGVNYNIYKCLYNNNAGYSTQQPTGQSTDIIEFPQDGYIWKFMYTIPNDDFLNFATTEYIPVIENQNVKNNANSGAIDIITVEDSGYDYSNHTTGIFSEVTIGGNPLLYALGVGSSNIDTFYNNCIIKMITGDAVNEYRTIIDYYISGGKNTITLDSPFTATVKAGDEYEIYPGVFVYDVSGTSTANCVARAIVSANTSNSISRVEVLTSGLGYSLATASINPANSVGITANSAATLRVITSPKGGHGSDVHSELYSRYVGITTAFVRDTAPLIANNDYRTVGILKQPLYNDVSIRIETSNTIGSFVVGENVFKYRPIRLYGNVSITSANTLVIGSNTNFQSTLNANDRVIVTNGTTNLFANISSITSDTQLNLDKVPTSTGSNFYIFLVQGDLLGKITSANTSYVTMTNVDPTNWDSKSFFVGGTSSCTTRLSANTPNLTVNGRDASSFNAFLQLTKYVGSLDTGTFEQDETITQFVSTTNNPIGKFHSYQENIGTANSYLFTSNTSLGIKTINEGGSGIISGLSSNAQFTAQYKYNGELVPDSGKILYLENLNKITRNVSQTETFKIILEY